MMSMPFMSGYGFGLGGAKHFSGGMMNNYYHRKLHHIDELHNSNFAHGGMFNGGGLLSGALAENNYGMTGQFPGIPGIYSPQSIYPVGPDYGQGFLKKRK